jgi:hypothetical protein
MHGRRSRFLHLCVPLFPPACNNEADEKGFGFIRLEIRRAEDDILLESEPVGDSDYGFVKTRVDLELIDDPLLGLRPYITFEFHLLQDTLIKHEKSDNRLM